MASLSPSPQQPSSLSILRMHTTSEACDATKKSRRVFDFSRETLSQYSFLRQDEAARALGVAPVTLKRICQRLQYRWPYRMLKAQARREGRSTEIQRQRSQSLPTGSGSEASAGSLSQLISAFRSPLTSPAAASDATQPTSVSSILQPRWSVVQKPTLPPLSVVRASLAHLPPPQMPPRLPTLQLLQCTRLQATFNTEVLICREPKRNLQAHTQGVKLQPYSLYRLSAVAAATSAIR